MPGPASGLDPQPKTQSALGYQAIRRMIVEWDLAPGSTIDERSIMAELGIGRTPIREALLRLSEQGLVVISPNRDIRVAPLDLDVIKELYEVRLQLDRLSAGLFMADASTAEREEVLESFAGAEESIENGDLRAVLDADFTFHRLIYTHGHNRFLQILHQNLTGHFFRIAFLVYHLDRRVSPETMHDLIESHQPIIAAIRSRDATALDATIRDHTINSYRRVIEVTTRHRLDLVANLTLERLREAMGAEDAATAANNPGERSGTDQNTDQHLTGVLQA